MFKKALKKISLEIKNLRQFPKFFLFQLFFLSCKKHWRNGSERLEQKPPLLLRRASKASKATKAMKAVARQEKNNEADNWQTCEEQLFTGRRNFLGLKTIFFLTPESCGRRVSQLQLEILIQNLHLLIIFTQTKYMVDQYSELSCNAVVEQELVLVSTIRQISCVLLLGRWKCWGMSLIILD